eukprot:TRINITY_DN3617_c0_g1_i23.p1 TRINITY_DN3617_c0_g1~~TRINITY_DN3617_c0_g1_i23.p1  ORF type:complete len:166 (-),score=51.23 TRINITY_DN3617_c0_g1_i23:221-676(-)
MASEAMKTMIVEKPKNVENLPDLIKNPSQLAYQVNERESIQMTNETEEEVKKNRNQRRKSKKIIQKIVYELYLEGKFKVTEDKELTKEERKKFKREVNECILKRMKKKMAVLQKKELKKRDNSATQPTNSLTKSDSTKIDDLLDSIHMLKI